MIRRWTGRSNSAQEIYRQERGSNPPTCSTFKNVEHVQEIYSLRHMRPRGLSLQFCRDFFRMFLMPLENLEAGLQKALQLGIAGGRN